MEKTLTIDGKQVTFKSTGAVPLRYKAQFKTDFFADVMNALNVTDLLNKPKIEVQDIQSINFEVFYQILWTMAKTADRDIPDPLTWLDEFDEFPLIDIIPDTIDLILGNLHSSKKK